MTPNITLTTWQEENLHTLAEDLDRLAYLVDPYEYWDVIGGRDEEAISAHVREIENDLRTGNTVPYITWLQDLIHDTDSGIGIRDWQRAASRLDHLLTWIMNGEEDC